MDRQVLQGHRVRKVSREFEAIAEIPDHLAHQVLLDPAVYPDFLGKMAHLEMMVRREQLEQQDHLDLEVSLECLVYLGSKVTGGFRDWMVQKETTGHLERREQVVHRDQWDLLGQWALQDHEGNEGVKDHQGHRELEALTVSQDHLEHPGQLANQDRLAFLGLLDPKVTWEVLDQKEVKVSRDLVEKPGSLDLQENLEQWDHPEKMDRQARKALRVMQVLQEHLAFLVLVDHQDFLAVLE